MAEDEPRDEAEARDDALADDNEPATEDKLLEDVDIEDDEAAGVQGGIRAMGRHTRLQQ